MNEGEMNEGDIFVVRESEIRDLLGGREQTVLELIRHVYIAHARGKSSLPFSIFLSLPDGTANRIIASPARLGSGFDIAGLKWIASVPSNLELGLARASAVLLLNSCNTGRCEAILEGSLISAARTAASAAVAAKVLLAGRPPECVGLIGAGPINLEIARFLCAALPGTARFWLSDLDPARAARAVRVLHEAQGAVEVLVATNNSEVLRHCPLISIATTAIEPHISDLSACVRDAVILNISLRDLAPQAILACDNIVDDTDHVCRAQTSVHLAEQISGSRDFIRATLGEILEEATPARRDTESIAVFSPFGLGILDLALGKLVRDLALAHKKGTVIRSFQSSAVQTLGA